MCEQCRVDPFDCPQSGERERTQQMAANLARLRGSPDPYSYHQRGRAVDVMPTDDPETRRSLLAASWDWVDGHVRADWPWWRRPNPYRQVGYVCAAGHRFRGYPPPGLVVCPECGTEDVHLEEQ